MDPKSSCCWTISEDGYSKLIFKNVYYIYSLRVFVWWCDIFSFAIFIGVNSSIFMLNVVPMIFNSHRIWFHVLGYSIESTLILMRRSWRKFTNYIKLLKLNFASRTRFKGQPLIFTLWFFCSLCFLGWLEAFSPQLVNSNMPLDLSTRDFGTREITLLIQNGAFPLRKRTNNVAFWFLRVISLVPESIQQHHP